MARAKKIFFFFCPKTPVNIYKEEKRDASFGEAKFCKIYGGREKKRGGIWIFYIYIYLFCFFITSQLFPRVDINSAFALQPKIDCRFSYYSDEFDGLTTKTCGRG